MARGPNEKVEEAYKLYKTGMKLVDIAAQLDAPPGTVRRWKSTYKWDGEQESERSVKKSERSGKNKNDNMKAIAKEVEEVIQNTDLTDKQRLFCIYYIRCFNATKAYQKAYDVDYATAASIGYRLLENVGVKEEILKLKRERLNREFLSEEDVFQKWMDIAFADITDFTEFGKKEIQYMDKRGNQQTAEISYVDLKDSSKVDGTLITEVSQGKDGVKIKLADRMKALQWLSDHMDLATEEQKAKVAILKAKIENPDETEENDDGFLEALNATAGEDWSDEED